MNALPGFTRPAAAAVCWRSTSPVLVGAAALTAALIPLTVLLRAAAPQLFNGVDAYLKPLKFEVSVVAYLLTLAAGRALLTAPARARQALWTSWLPTAAGVGEVVYILFRAARGEASHYSQTLEGRVAFGLMGVGAMLLVVGTGVLGAQLLRQRRRGERALAVEAMALGLMITTWLGGLSGAVLSVNGAHLVGARGPVDDAGQMALTTWSLTHGDLRVSHFLALHAAQLLPLVALAGRRREGATRTAVRVAAVVVSVFALATLVQALLGLPLGAVRP